MNNKTKNWNIVNNSKSGQEYIQPTTLKEGPRSKTTAVFFGIHTRHPINILFH